MQNYKLTLQYDGSRYLGWQRLPNSERTIQGKLEQILSRLLNEPIFVVGSGRTDAGVHARGQVASFCCASEMPCGEILSGLRCYLPEDIGAVSLEPVPERFHARLSAVRKHYRYRIRNGEGPRVFERRYEYAYPLPLDLAAMERAAALLTGTHDYRSFCAKKSEKKSAVRTVERIALCVSEETGDSRLLELDFIGNGFLYQMVRILTGTLLEVGRGLRQPEEMPALLAAKDRALAGFTVPAKGLCLMEVEYA